MSFNKEGIRSNPFNKKKAYKHFFVQGASKKRSHILCNYCLRKGHISYSCPLRKSTTKMSQVWIPKGAKPPYVN